MEGYHAFCKQWDDPEFDGFVLTTSGSTGKPKPFTLYKKWLTWSALQTAKSLGLNQNDSIYCCIPTNKVGGFMLYVRAKVLQCELFESNPQANPMLPLDNQHSFTFISLLPYQLYHILNDSLARAKLNRFKVVLVGGADIDELLVNELQNLQPQFYHSYGMTETYSHIALRKLNKGIQSHFFAFPTVEVSQQLTNQTLIIKAPFCPEGLQTNDVVTFNNDGGFVVEGRVDNVIVSGGVKLFPEKIEQMIQSLGVMNGISFAISSEKHPALGEQVVLVANSIEIQNVLATLKSQLPPYVAPKKWISIPEIPLTYTGKINRAKLKELLSL
jgi:o-succinylbenzoate---CoA ligase